MRGFDGRSTLLLVGLVVALGALYASLRITTITDGYLRALDLCDEAPATAAARIARLDRAYSQWWRDQVPEELLAEADECVLAASEALSDEQDGGG